MAQEFADEKTDSHSNDEDDNPGELAQVVGTIIKTSQGYVLVTDLGSLELLPISSGFGTWEGRPVLIVGKRVRKDAVDVTEVCPLMKESEIIECASFLLQVHGAGAKQHALNRLNTAIEHNDPGEIQIWQAISRKIGLHLTNNPWAKKIDEENGRCIDNLEGRGSI